MAKREYKFIESGSAELLGVKVNALIAEGEWKVAGPHHVALCPGAIVWSVMLFRDASPEALRRRETKSAMPSQQTLAEMHAETSNAKQPLADRVSPESAS